MGITNMNTRRGFLESIIKAAVGSIILPPAITYARAKWKARSSGVLTLADLQDAKRILTSDIDKYARLPFYLMQIEVNAVYETPLWKSMLAETTWKPNMGGTMRGIRI
jgi:hypothetical protein